MHSPSFRHRPVQTSVILPVHNREQWLEETIQSVLEQDMPDTEIIAVDDASSDNSTAILAGFGDKVRLHRLAQRRGVAHARNTAIAMSRGEYLAFIDSDDLWLPGKLHTQIAAMEADHSLGLCFSDYVMEQQDADNNWHQLKICSHPESPHDFNRLFRENFIGTLTVVLRRACYQDVGGFDETLTRGSDFDQWLRIAARWKLAHLPAVVAKYRRHADSLTGIEPLRDLETYTEVTERWLEHDPGLLDRIGWSHDARHQWIAEQRQLILDRSHAADQQTARMKPDAK